MIAIQELNRSSAAEIVAVRVTALHMSGACDDLCEVIGHQTYDLNKGSAAPGWTFRSQRLLLALDDAEGSIKAAGRNRYPDYYLTSYLVRIYFADGKNYKTILTDMF